MIAQTPTFSTTLEAVRLDVLVTDRGRVVRGLGPSDFEVLDNGVAQQVDLVSFEQLPLNLIFGLDLSGSLSGERLDHLRSAGQALLKGLTGEDRAGLVTFSHVVVLREGLTSDLGRLRRTLEQMQPLGDTSLHDGSYAALMVGESEAGRDLLILFSDGLDTASWLSPDQVLETARRSDAVVYGVSVRGSGATPFLRDLSELTGGSVFEIESTKNLSARFVSILEEFRQRYVVSFSPRGVSSVGWHRLNVRLKARQATVKTRTGYQAGS